MPCLAPRCLDTVITYNRGADTHSLHIIARSGSKMKAQDFLEPRVVVGGERVRAMAEDYAHQVRYNGELC